VFQCEGVLVHCLKAKLVPHLKESRPIFLEHLLDPNNLPSSPPKEPQLERLLSQPLPLFSQAGFTSNGAGRIFDLEVDVLEESGFEYTNEVYRIADKEAAINNRLAKIQTRLSYMAKSVRIKAEQLLALQKALSNSPSSDSSYNKKNEGKDVLEKTLLFSSQNVFE
jgi:hypothetical protein